MGARTAGVPFALFEPKRSILLGEAKVFLTVTLPCSDTAREFSSVGADCLSAKRSSLRRFCIIFTRTSLSMEDSEIASMTVLTRALREVTSLSRDSFSLAASLPLAETVFSSCGAEL